jgi:hypothetical protein
MSAASHSTDLLSQDTPVELAELKRAIDALPTAQRLTLQCSFDRVLESTARRRKILQLVQEALGQLRLDMKYLVFDLEATRRERDTFREQLKELTGEEGFDSNPEDE